MRGSRLVVCMVLALMAPLWALSQVWAGAPRAMEATREEIAARNRERIAQRPTIEQRLAAARRQAAARSGIQPQQVPGPGGKPRYYGPEPNWTNSPIIRKFVDLLPGVGPGAANNLGQYIPVAVPDTTTYPGCDYYELQLRQYREQMHSDLPPTTLRGYVQVKNGVQVTPANYLGPIIVAQKGRPVRIKFTNRLPLTGSGVEKFAPVDRTVMGAGEGPGGAAWGFYSDNRSVIHLHGGLTPWISDGTPHQWITPAGEPTFYPRGVSAQNVPDMPDPGDGSVTYFWPNQQSARLMFYHDHAWGITRLNVYYGAAAPYVLTDDTEAKLISDGIIPADEIPLVIQDKTYVPRQPQLAATDPTWDTSKWGGYGDLWYPHVYMPNQNPNAVDGVNPVGRFDYGPWFWPPWPVTNAPYQDGSGDWQPNLPDVSAVMEAMGDTAVINGTAYPLCRVERKAYRFRILNASNDRWFNLGLYYAKSNTPDAVDPVTGLPTLQTLSGEIPTIPANPGTVLPEGWPQPDAREGGLPDPAAVGPPFIQIANEGGFLPAPVVINSTPIGYDWDRRSITFGLIREHGLRLGPAERADVIVDFSRVPEGSRLILYNDAPAPAPFQDPRVDYFTGNPDLTDAGGAPSTNAGYGPNTRTLMQFEVSGPAAPRFNLAGLEYAFASHPGRPGVFARSQDPILVPQEGYNSAYDANFPNGWTAYGRLHDTSLTFTPMGAAAPMTIPFTNKAIAEEFESEWGRMTAFLGVEVPFTNGWNQTTIFYTYSDPLTESIDNNAVPLTPILGDGTQIWKITHNGIDDHTVHFHLFNVQIVNRVDWAGIVKPPNPNELGWKETVRMSAFEDTIVALRPYAPALPFGLPNSVRPLNPSLPLGSMMGFTNMGPDGVPYDPPPSNIMFNFGWEYVWHCHILAHEEMDMMRPIQFNVEARRPVVSDLAGVRGPGGIVLTWVDGTPAATSWGHPANEIGFRIERATGNGNFNLLRKMLANTAKFTDSSIQPDKTYRYRVIAYNAAGERFSNTITVAP